MNEPVSYSENRDQNRNWNRNRNEIEPCVSCVTLFLEPVDIVKSILSLLDFCGKFFVQDMAHVSQMEGLSNFHSWQYLYAPFLDHMMDEIVTLLRRYCACIKLTSVSHITPYGAMIENML